MKRLKLGDKKLKYREVGIQNMAKKKKSGNFETTQK